MAIWWGLGPMSMILAVMLARAVDGKPLGDPSAWIKSDDYPKSALTRGVSGTVAVEMLVDKNGMVKDCNISQTSGSDALDATTCLVLRLRARFTPAQDIDGKNIEFMYRRKVRWQVPTGVSMPMPSLPQTLTVAVDENEKGVVEDCTVLTRPDGTSDEAPTPCINYPVGRQLRVMTDANGKPVKVRVVLSNSVNYLLRDQ